MHTKRIGCKKARREIQNYYLIINHLINSYCLNPNKKICASEVEKELKLNYCNILSPFLRELRKKKILKSKGMDAYIITFDGFEKLMKMRDQHRTFSHNIITLVFCVSTFAITILNMISSNNKGLILVIGTIVFCSVNYYIKKI